MNEDFLTKTSAPWLHVLIGENSGDGVIQPTSPDVSLLPVVRGLRGSKMQTQQALFDEISAALQFPSYFGENWDALDECLADLSWLPGRAYILLVAQSDLVLLADDASLAVFLEILGRVGDEWAKPLEGPPGFARGPKPFHTILQVTRERAGVFETRIRRVAPGIFLDRLFISPLTPGGFPE